MAVIQDPPTFTELVDTSRRMTSKWLDWFLLTVQTALGSSVNQAVAALRKSGLTASLPATTLLAAAVAPSYRLTVYVRTTTADGVSSSVTVTAGWNENGLALTKTVTLLSSDSPTAPASGSLTVDVDASAPITVSTTYASNTPNKMVYKLTAELEAYPS